MLKSRERVSTFTQEGFETDVNLANWRDIQEYIFSLVPYYLFDQAYSIGYWLFIYIIDEKNLNYVEFEYRNRTGNRYFGSAKSYRKKPDSIIHI